MGLHPKDLQNIATILKQIRDKENTVLVVEHDPDLIKIADWIVDMGPKSGKDGGQIIYEGNFESLSFSKGKTGQYFATKPTINLNPRIASDYLYIKNASLYNLKDLSLQIPKNVLTVVTGVAGSGKSILLNKVLPRLYPQVTLVDQSPFTANARSTILTFLNLSDDLRKKMAKANAISDKLFSRYSLGACENCKGLGIEKIDLAFLDDVQQPCELCKGTGFKAEVLQYKYNNKTIVELLDMTINEAIVFFKKSLTYVLALTILIKLGLGYLTLGQRLNTFSGGERQRLKLSKELNQTNKIIILDEPSTGLHPSDTQILLDYINNLVEQGNTLIVIEHNLDIITKADWIVDIGPGAGKDGGTIVFTGTVSDVLKDNNSITGSYLKRHISSRSAL